MLRNRLLILLGGCLLTASAALADDLGFVDCTTHPDETQVYAKARKSQDVVGTIPCGERFKIVLYGFIFSEIQTADGKVGFVFSNVVTVERAGGTLQARAASPTTPSLSAASEVTKVPAAPKPAPAPRQRTVAPPTPLASASEAARMGGATSLPEQPAAAPAAPEVSSAPAAPATPDTQATTIAAQPPAAAPAQPQPVAEPAQPQPAPAPGTLPDSSSVLKQTTGDPTATAAAPVSTAPVSAPSPADAAPATTAPPTPADATPTAAPSTNTAEPAAPAPAPAPATAEAAPVPVAQPEPAAPQPQPPAFKSGKVKSESWEKPNPGAKSIAMVELYGGFSLARTNSGGTGGTSNNLIGGMGSFGWNIKPWIQIVGDTSYNVQTVSGTKNVLYGNHYGPRYYLRIRNPWHITPFAEALFGGSRADSTVSGAGGYTSSTNCFSYKVGGGIDMRTGKLFEIRVIDFDYYRTAFGTGVHQNNYSISTGIVLRLFAGKSL